MNKAIQFSALVGIFGLAIFVGKQVFEKTLAAQAKKLEREFEPPK